MPLLSQDHMVASRSVAGIILLRKQEGMGSDLISVFSRMGWQADRFGIASGQARQGYPKGRRQLQVAGVLLVNDDSKTKTT